MERLLLQEDELVETQQMAADAEAMHALNVPELEFAVDDGEQGRFDDDFAAIVDAYDTTTPDSTKEALAAVPHRKQMGSHDPCLSKP